LPGPYVNLAAFCEKVLQERDGVLTLVRVVDRVMVATTAQDAPAELPEGGRLTATLVLALKSGDAIGRHPVVITAESPDGSAAPPQTVDVMFEGEDRGLNLILNLQIDAVEGVHWFVVSVNDQELTRVPLRIMYQRIPGFA
jgi:hypothetical protein